MFSTIILFILFSISPLISSNGVFEVKFKSLFETEKELVNITVCIKEYQTIVHDDNNCRYGVKKLSISPLINETFIVSLPFTQTWPGSHSLIINFGSNDTFKVSQLLSGKTSWLHVTSNKLFEIQYRITCSSKYYGNKCSRFCNSPIYENDHFICTNEGTIKCIDGWSGEKCNKPICTKGCGQNGKCIGPNKCQCSNSMIQESCEDCILLPGCQNGYCSKANKCTCNEGWGGELCNIRLNLCQLKNTCKNGGICKSKKDGTFSCECKNGYYGRYCQKKKKTCNEHICLNNGTCYIHSDGTPTCKCINNFIGNYCQIKLIKNHKINVEIKGGQPQNINFSNINMILFIIALLMLFLLTVLVSILIYKNKPKIISIEKCCENGNINISKIKNEYTLEPNVLNYNTKIKDFSTTTPQLEFAKKEKLCSSESIRCLKPFNNIYYTISYE
uniref:Delta-like protein n=1 Tax=Strongyloides stercoralis TaxID=6248 RepID=A0A0K0E8Y1_STRER